MAAAKRTTTAARWTWSGAAGLDVSVSFQLPVEERIVLEAAMDKLKDLEQTVLSEFYFKDLNQTEIAKNLGISCNYVSHILRSSTKKLKKILVTDDLKEAQRKVAQMQKRSGSAAGRSSSAISWLIPLTRCYNQPLSRSRDLDEEISRASRIKADLSLLTVELRRDWKRFTRTHGTLKGDEAVMGIAETIKNTVRKADIVTRCETEQFTLILPHTGRNCLVVAERVREATGQISGAKGLESGRGLSGTLVRNGAVSLAKRPNSRFAVGTRCFTAPAKTAQEQDEAEALPLAA